MSKLGKWCLGILLCGVILVGASWALGLRDFNIGNSAFRGEKKTRRLETVTDVTVKLTLQNFEIRQGGTGHSTGKRQTQYPCAERQGRCATQFEQYP